MNNQLPTIAMGIVVIMRGPQTGTIGVFINTLGN